MSSLIVMFLIALALLFISGYLLANELEVWSIIVLMCGFVLAVAMFWIALDYHEPTKAELIQQYQQKIKELQND